MLSAFDIFKIGIGPSSSHTVGPMKAAAMFVRRLSENHMLASTTSIQCELFGSLALTGKGHGTDKAVMLGLMGKAPETVEIDLVEGWMTEIARHKRIHLTPTIEIHFDPLHDLIYRRRETLPQHTNGMRFTALGDSAVLLQSDYYSVGGGFIYEGEIPPVTQAQNTPLPFIFRNADQLLQLCDQHGLSIAGLMMKNENSFRPPQETRTSLVNIWKVMQASIDRGCQQEGVLPGSLRLTRRAPPLHRKLTAELSTSNDPLNTLDWVDLFALAVNEENAAGGRVVTAPTNGAAGIVPAVLAYYDRFVHHADDDAVCRYLLTCAAIGMLYKYNASISGAEVGCQGEVGVACSMAAAGLTELLGGSAEAVENAAEIGMEHNLGLTCDPVGGLVQVPCIERNAMGAVKAINAARLAMRGTGKHKVSLDKVIRTMRETGEDMRSKYKETARGGLAVNVIEC